MINDDAQPAADVSRPYNPSRRDHWEDHWEPAVKTRRIDDDIRDTLPEADRRDTLRARSQVTLIKAEIVRHAAERISARQEAKRRASQPAWKRIARAIWWSPVLAPLRIAWELIAVLWDTATGGTRLYDMDKVVMIAFALFLPPLLIGPSHATPLPADSRHSPNYPNPSFASSQFSVFDCEDAETRFTPVDMTATQACPDPEKDYDPEYKTKVFVLQSDAKALVDVFSCQLYFTKEVTRCGSLHHSFGSERPAIDQRYTISAEECREWAENEQFWTNAEYFGGESQLLLLPLNEWTHRDYYSHGLRRADGSCEWDSWMFGNRRYKKSYERTTLKARLRKLTGVVNPETGTMTIGNGLVVNYKDGTALDGVQGTAVWEHTNRNCSDSVSLIYEGEVAVHRLNKKIRSTKADEWAGTIIVMEDVKNKQTGAFIIKPQRANCMADCHLTHIPGLLVCLDPHRIKDDLVYKSGAGQDVKTLMAAVTHTRIAGAFDTGKKFAGIQQQLCDVSLEGKLHQLSDVAGNGNHYALRKLVVPGVGLNGRKYIPGGAAGYVASCPERNATLFAFPNCTLQIPIMLTGRTNGNLTQEIHFADPITMVVQRLPTIVPCSTLMPIRWLIQGQWFCSTPRVDRCDAPVRLGTDLDMSGLGPAQTDFNPLEGVLFSPEQQRQNAAFQRATSYKEPAMQAIVNNMAKGASVDAAGRIHYGMPFDTDQIDSIADQVSGKVFFMFAFFGRYYTIIVGMLFALAVGKLVFGVLLRTYVLYRKRGCGLWLVTALWHTSFLLLGMPWKVARKVYDGAMEEVDKAQAEGLEPCSYEHLDRAVRGLADGLEKQQGLIYSREDRLENLLRAIANSDHGLARHAQTLLRPEQPQPQELLEHRGDELNRENSSLLPTASTQNKGSAEEK